MDLREEPIMGARHHSHSAYSNQFQWINIVIRQVTKIN